MAQRKSAAKGNVGKHTNYTWAIEQMAKAREQGFFLETIAIAESILSDRIWSYVQATTGGPLDAHKVTLGSIINYGKAFEKASPELHKEVGAWAKTRNQLMHGIVKSPAGTPPMPLAEFQALAQKAAEEALPLVRAVDAWHKKQV
jgi:hypothetical protein